MTEDIPHPRRSPRATPPTPWLPFSNSLHSAPAEHLSPPPDPQGRVLVFTQIGLDQFDDHGPRLELTADDVAAGNKHLWSLITVFVASRLDGPVESGELRVQFDPNISHGCVRPADRSWPSTAELARFRVYKKGACPQAKAKVRARERVKFWVLVNFSAALLAGFGFWAAGSAGAVLAAAVFLAFVCLRYGF